MCWRRTSPDSSREPAGRPRTLAMMATLSRSFMRMLRGIPTDGLSVDTWRPYCLVRHHINRVETPGALKATTASTELTHHTTVWMLRQSGDRLQHESLLRTVSC